MEICKPKLTSCTLEVQTALRPKGIFGKSLTSEGEHRKAESAETTVEVQGVEETTYKSIFWEVAREFQELVRQCAEATAKSRGEGEC